MKVHTSSKNRYGKWRVLERDIIRSSKWTKLTPIARCVLVRLHDQLEFEKGRDDPKNMGIVGMQTSELAAVEGLTEADTVAAIEEVLRMKFFRQIEQDTYQISSDWQLEEEPE